MSEAAKAPEIFILRGGPCDGQQMPKGEATINVAHHDGYCEYSFDDKANEYHPVKKTKKD